MEFPDSLCALVRSVRSVVVLTGAGISAESGVSTFRDALTGLWAQYRPEELATPQAFINNPALVWNWYAWRRELAQRADPNPGHRALADLENKINIQGRDFSLITQNVDGLHQRAGSKQIIELHGNILRTKCFDDDMLVDHWQGDEIPPRCPRCRGMLRPDVVWFGEYLPAEAIDAAWKAAQEGELFFSIGTSSLVEPAASLPYLAHRSGAHVVEINPNKTPLSPIASYVIQAPAGEALPELVARAFSRAN